MTFVPMVDKAAGDPVTLAMWNSLKDNLNKGVMRPIAYTELSAPATSIVMSGIAADWVDLLVMVSAQPENGTMSYVLRLNGDAGANYRNQIMTTSSGSPSFGQSVADTGVLCGASTQGLFWIPGYAASGMHRMVHGAGGLSATAMFRGAGVWASTAVVTDVSLVTTFGTFAAGTRVAIYGVSGV